MGISEDERVEMSIILFSVFYCQVPCGTKQINESAKPNKYVETNYQNNLLTSMLETHLVSDLCLIGPKGCGKSTTVQTLADLTGYQIEPVVLYQASVTFSLLSCWLCEED